MSSDWFLPTDDEKEAGGLWLYGAAVTLAGGTLMFMGLLCAACLYASDEIRRAFNMREAARGGANDVADPPLD